MVSDEGDKSHSTENSKIDQITKKKTLKIYTAYLLLLTMIGPAGVRAHTSEVNPNIPVSRKGERAYHLNSEVFRGESVN